MSASPTLLTQAHCGLQDTPNEIQLRARRHANFQIHTVANQGCSGVFSRQSDTRFGRAIHCGCWSNTSPYLQTQKEATLKKQITMNADFIARPSVEEIENAMRIVKVRAVARKRQRTSKFRKYIPTIFALLEAGTSLRDACLELRELHGFEGSASALCRFLQSYPLLHSKLRSRGFGSSN